MDKLTIIQHNVRHWNDKRHALTNIYNNIDADIILLNDHSLTNDKRLKIFNYNTYQTNVTNRLHRGAAIAVKKHIAHRLIDDFDSDMLGITIQTRHGPMTIGTTHIPPNAPYLNFIDFNRLFKRQEPAYLLGDINARHPTLGHNDSNNVGRSIDLLMTARKIKNIGLYFPTFLTYRSTTSPDIVLTNNKDFYNYDIKPGPMTPSDHIPIVLTISCNPIQIPIKLRLQIAKADWDGYKRDLINADNHSNAHSTPEDIDRQISDWTQQIQTATDKNIPTIRYRTIPSVTPTEDIRQLTLQYNATLDHIRQYGPSLDLMRQINALRRQMTLEYHLIQNDNWNKIIEKLNFDRTVTNFWKSIKRLSGNNKQKTPYIRDHDNNKLHTPEDKERLFRQHWTKIFSDIDDPDNDFDTDFTNSIERIVQDNRQTLSNYPHSDLTRLDDNTPPITLNELNATLRKFRQRAPGLTGITTLHLKNLPPNMTQALLNIFNKALSTGYFPRNWKTAKIIFLPKPKSSQYQVQNYRPISLLEVPGKLIDKILNTRLTLFFDRHNLTNDRQHGFRHDRGTDTALALFYETISNDLYNRLTIDVVLRDVSKAFDKVWHTGLKYKLLQTRLPTCLLKTVTDFLNDRTATINIDNYLGPLFPLKSGVPQGACLSPSLYSFYTHDMPPPHY